MTPSRASSSLAALAALTLLAACKQDLAHRVQDRIKKNVPDAVVTIKDSSTLDVKVGEQRVTVSLDNLTTICKNEPDRCDEAINGVVKNVDQLSEPEKPMDPQELRAVLKSTATVQDTRNAIKAQSPPDKLADNQIVTFPFQGDMQLVLVRDMPNGIAMLNHGALGDLKIDEEKAKAIGLANDEKLFLSLPTETASPGVLRVKVGDSYEASRILVPKLWDSVAKQVNGDLLVVAPTRDIVFATGSKDTAGLASMKSLAKKAFDEGPYSLSTVMLRRTDAGFVVAALPKP